MPLSKQLMISYICISRAKLIRFADNNELLLHFEKHRLSVSAIYKNNIGYSSVMSQRLGVKEDVMSL